MCLPEPPLDGWLLRPAEVLRFGVCTVLSAVTVPFLLHPLHERWRDEDRAARRGGSGEVRPSRRSNGALLIKGGLLFLVYLVTGAFYLLSWSTYALEGIQVRTPLGTRTYTYDQVTQLLVIPPGYRDGPSKPGPEFAMELDDGRWAYFGLHSEGAEVEDLEAIARMVSRESGLEWKLNPRASRSP